jgi:hypothetical protein
VCDCELRYADHCGALFGRALLSYGIETHSKKYTKNIFADLRKRSRSRTRPRASRTSDKDIRAIRKIDRSTSKVLPASGVHPFRTAKQKARPKLEFGRARLGVKHEALFKGAAYKCYHRISATHYEFDFEDCASDASLFASRFLAAIARLQEE